MGNHEQGGDAPKLDEKIAHMRVVVLLRLARRLGLETDEAQVREWIKVNNDVEVLRKIERSHDRRWKNFLKPLWGFIGRRL